MGLQADMGLPPLRTGWLQRALQRVAATRLGTAVLGRIVVPLDGLLHRISKGRTTASRALGGFPAVMLTTVGARSGERRTIPMNVIPFREDLALVGSNQGRGVTPAWAHNLRKNPAAEIAYGDRTIPVLASEIDTDTAAAEYEEVFATATAIYRGYARYRQRGGNGIPVFLLTARSPSG